MRSVTTAIYFNSIHRGCPVCLAICATMGIIVLSFVQVDVLQTPVRAHVELALRVATFCMSF